MKNQDKHRFISRYVDDAQSSEPFEVDENTRLIGWQCGFEPLFVAVRSYLPGIRLDDEEAEELATDLLIETEWFVGGSREADFVL